MISSPVLSLALEVAAKSALVLAVAALAGFALRGAHAARRHRAWAFGLLLALFVPLLVVTLPSLRLPVWRAAAAPAVAAPVPVSAEPSSPSGQVERAPAAARPVALVPRTENVVSVEPPRAGNRFALAAALVGLWALGSLLLLARIAASLARAAAVARRGRPIDVPELAEALAMLGIERRVRLLESGRVNVPMTGGILRPVLIVPAGFAEWSAECRRLVLLHELAHIRRGDVLLNLASEIALALHWFQPLAWLAARRVREEAEVAADDVVLGTGALPSTYASYLLAIVQGLPRSGASLMTVGMGATPIERRLKKILAANREPRAGRVRPALLLLVVALTAVLAATKLGASPAPRAGREAKSGAATEAASADQVAALVARAVRAAVVRSEHYVVHAHNVIVRHVHGASNSAHSSHHEGALEAKNDKKESVELAEQAEERETDGGGQAFERAHELHKAEKYEQAVQAWQEAARLGYRKGTALYNLACAQARLGEGDLAMQSLMRAIEVGFDPGDYLERDRDLAALRGDPRFKALVEEHGSGDRKRALARLERIEHAGARDFDTWYQLGKELHEVGEYDDAARAWRKSLELAPANASAIYNVACAEAMSGQAKSALDDLDRAVEAGFSSAEHIEQDEDFASLRDDPRFARILDRARALELPDGATGWSCWGSCGPSANEWREVKARNEKLAQVHPESGRAWSNVGFARLRLGEAQGAVDAFRAAFDKGYRPDASAYNVACAYAAMKDADRAFEWLDRARAAGFEDEGMLANDPDVDNLRDDPRFPAVDEQHGKRHSERHSHEGMKKIEEY